jgi:hypothetical protein
MPMPMPMRPDTYVITCIRAAETRKDAGNVLVIGALALVPVMALLALAVDVVAWQTRAAALQRAADAAAAAGVPLLPSVPDAAGVARSVSGLNGIHHGVDGVDITVTPLSAATLEVAVRDTQVRRWFSAPFTGPVTIERRAVAEYLPEVALGSPRNVLGAGDLAGNPDPYVGLPGVPASDDVWLAVNGPCAGREQGDWLLPVSTANFATGNPPSGYSVWRGCTPAAHPLVTTVASRDPVGYLIGLRVPDAYPGGPFTIQIFDASRCAGSGADLGAAGAPFWTRWRVRDADPTPGYPLDNPVLHTRTLETGQGCGTTTATSFACGDGIWQGRWCNLATITAPLPGATYLVQVDTGPISDTAQHQLNGFSVRVRPGTAVSTGGFEACTVDQFDNAIAYRPETCVQVAGVRWLSVFAFGSSPRPTFALADVGVDYAGATLEASLFDVGEGTVAVELLDPTGQPAGFSWSVFNETGSDVAPTGGWSGVVAPGGSLDVRGLTDGDPCGGGNLQPGPGRYSSSAYNDRMLRLRVALPADLQAAYAGRTWWKVRYTSCGQRTVSDRTTWGARIAGEPVRLVR